MNNSEQQSAPRRDAITLAVWRRAPLNWSLFWIGRRLNDGGSHLAEIGERLMALAIDRLVQSSAAEGLSRAPSPDATQTEAENASVSFASKDTKGMH